MDELERALRAVLDDPAQLRELRELAGSMGFSVPQAQPESAPAPTPPEPEPVPEPPPAQAAFQQQPLPEPAAAMLRQAGKMDKRQEALLLEADSIGLGIFSVHGSAVAIRAGLGGNVFLTLLVGMLTGVGGGVLRDLCCMERPYIFTKHIYACASLAGAAACMLLWSAGENLALLTGCALTVVLRLCAAVFRWSLPKA